MAATILDRRPLVRVVNVRHHYGRGHGRALVLDNVDLTLDENEIVGLLGRSGSGKSTLFRCDPHLIALDAPWPAKARSVRFVQRLSARPRVGRLSIVIDGREVAALDSDRLLLGTPMQGLQIGRNGAVRASPRYAAPFAFDGRIERVEIRTDNKPYDAGEIAAASRAYAAPARKD